MATTTTVHAQFIHYETNGDQIIVNLKNTGEDVSITRTNTKLPTTVTSAQTLANALGNLAFKDSLSKSDVGLGSVDNTADANKSVKYATSAGSASSATKATQDSAGQAINSTYIKSLSVSGRTITITKGNNTTSTITTQDTNTDTKVTQTAIKSSDYTNWRTIPWGSSNSGSEGFTPTTVTDVMYSDPNLTYQPSSGTLRARTFKGNLSGTVYGTSYEANLEWGGRNFTGSYGPIDAAMIPALGANRLAFIPPDSITITYSRDGGSTWTDYGASSDLKRGLFSTGGTFTIGKADSTNKATANSTKYQLRITIDTDKASVYTVLNKFAIYVSTNGSNSCWCSIDASLEKTPTTWVNFAKQVAVSGWSGWNIINTNGLTTYGNSPTVQYGLVRFTFGANGGNTNYTGLQVTQILGFGGVGWTVPSNMARTGHLYAYDIWQNAFFPAQINANNMLMNTCVTCSNWNDAVKTGWYMASGASNAPTSGAWYFGMVIAHNSNYVIQELYQFTASTDAKAIPKFIRAKNNGTWGSWTDVTIQVKVPSNAKFTDTNTWRGIQDNLTSTAKDQSLSANQGKVLKGLVDGKASSSHGHYSLSTIGDKRSENTTPRSYANNMIFQGLKNSSTIGSPSSNTYSYLLGLKGWSDDSGGKAHELAFNDKGIFHRTGPDAGGWGNWSRVITSAIGDPVYVSKNTPTEPCIWVKLD